MANINLIGTAMIKAYVFTNVPEGLFLKQSPGFSRVVNGVELTVGMDKPGDVDVLILFTRASYSVPTRLPSERTIFVTGEPDVIHPLSGRFLNQFGQILTTSTRALQTRKIYENFCSIWFAGVDFSKPYTSEHLKGYDYFKTLECPAKSDKISIVTSDKADTEYHRKRLAFIDILKERIPEHLDIYGRGFKSIDDKSDALLPHKYHLAIENGNDAFGWTEKLSDPLLTWSFPFHAGCPNITDDLPAGCFEPINLDAPEAEADRMIREIQNGRWDTALPAIAQARQKILDDYNLTFKLAELAKKAMEIPVAEPRLRRTRLVRSERSLLPEKGARGSYLQWAIRASLLRLDPMIELRLSKAQQKIKARRAERRKLRDAAKEAENQR
ncbi:MAG: hypothetical protein ABJ327_16350 [Litoreibacter sp.]